MLARNLAVLGLGCVGDLLLKLLGSIDFDSNWFYDCYVLNRSSENSGFKNVPYNLIELVASNDVKPENHNNLVKTTKLVWPFISVLLTLWLLR